MNDIEVRLRVEPENRTIEEILAWAPNKKNHHQFLAYLNDNMARMISKLGRNPE
jgi:hypothetical protein